MKVLVSGCSHLWHKGEVLSTGELLGSVNVIWGDVISSGEISGQGDVGLGYLFQVYPLELMWASAFSWNNGLFGRFGLLDYNESSQTKNDKLNSQSNGL